MRRAKKTLIIGAALLVLNSQMPGFVAAQSDSQVNPVVGITQNEPRIIHSKEVSFRDNTDTGSDSILSKKILVAVGATILAGLLLGISAGGGSSDGGSGEAASGDVSITW